MNNRKRRIPRDIVGIGLAISAVLVAIVAAVPDWATFLETHEEVREALSPYWESFLRWRLAGAVIIVMGTVAFGVFRSRSFIIQQGKRLYLRILWYLVVRPAKDHLNVMVSPESGTLRPEELTDIRDVGRVGEAKRIELSGGTVVLRDFGPVQLVRIPAGEFSMGGWSQQPLCLDTFYISQWPITNAVYRYFITATGHEAPFHWIGRVMPSNKGDHPVVHVSWYDACAYCDWLSRETGHLFRLPTEAEWEKAAQASQRREYPWGDEFDESKCNAARSGIGDTTPRGKYSPQGDSRYGVADMAGNVWEWTSSLDKELPYNPDDGREDREADGDRILRGGSFKSYREEVRCGYRQVHNQPGASGDEIGFRIAVSAESSRDD